MAEPAYHHARATTGRLYPRPCGTRPGEELAQIFKQPVVVDNRPSASQIIASNLLARAAPDGHTLMVSVMPNVIAPHLQKAQNSQAIRTSRSFLIRCRPLDFWPSPAAPVNNLKDFIALLKANPASTCSVRPASAHRCTCF
ncbi:tripartite tricarboxylate transporter substrate-binding protein [Cupriavidus basilensis]